MTQEDKELLLKDLCARLPYDVKVNCNDKAYNFAGIAFTTAGIKYIKPYLFPLSSMTEKQREEYHKLLYPENGINIDCFDWCQIVEVLFQKDLQLITGKDLY